MKFKILCLLVILCSCSSENKKVEGEVTDVQGEALEDVMVQVMGTDLFTYTNQEGYFAINTKSRGNELIFILEGYKMGRLDVKDNELMQISLISSSVVNQADTDSIQVLELE